MNNNLLSIEAMHHWVKSNGSTPAPENYVERYLNSIGVSSKVDLVGMEDDGLVWQGVHDPTHRDMEEEIELLDRNEAVKNCDSEDCETMQELVETINPSFE